MPGTSPTSSRSGTTPRRTGAPARSRPHPSAPSDGAQQKGSTMKVSIDTAKCAGHARCNVVAPNVYTLDDEGYARPYDGEVPPGLEREAREGAEACPERAIALS